MLNKSWIFTFGLLFSEKTKKTMTSTTTGCPLEMCRKSGFLFCSWSVSVFPTRHAALKSTASCSLNLDRFHRSTFYRPSAVNCCRCPAQSVFSCIFLLFYFPVVLVASAVIQRLVLVMSLRTNSWVGNSNWLWKFCSVSCSSRPVAPPPQPNPSHFHSSPSQSCTLRPSSHSQLFRFRHN